MEIWTVRRDSIEQERTFYPYASAQLVLRTKSKCLEMAHVKAEFPFSSAKLEFLKNSIGGQRLVALSFDLSFVDTR
jgi:hypothetical protein